MKRTGEMTNALWIAIHSDKPFPVVSELFRGRNLSQKQMSDFWKTFNQVRDYLN